MTPEELKRNLADLDIKPALFAERVGVTRATAWNWLSGRCPVPRYVELVLMLTRSNRHLVRQEIDRAA